MSHTRRKALSQLAGAAVIAALVGGRAAAETTTYKYDSLGRLVRVTFANGQIVQYSYDSAGNRTQVVRVNGPPVISSFTASPTSITSGAASTLSWATSNATAISIDNGVGAVAAIGSTSVSPGPSTTYTLTATGPGGQTTAQATVTVVGGFTQTIQVTGAGPVNLRTLANNAGYNGAQNANVTFEVGSGVTITGAAGSPDGGIGIDSGTWPTGSHSIALTLTIKNGAVVRGGGGRGGEGGSSVSGATGGGLGGDAIYCRLPMTVNINAGATAGGGGDGGQGADVIDPDPFDANPPQGGGGGGGGGAPNGPGGNGGVDPNMLAGGAGGSGAVSGGGAGGAGGWDGDAGAPGLSYGSNGFCVRKNGHAVTVNNNGTTAGAIG